MIFWSKSWILVHFSTLDSLTREPIYLSLGNAYAVASFLAGTESQGYEKEYKMNEL